MFCEGLANFSATCMRTVGANDGLQLCGCDPSVNREPLVKFVCIMTLKVPFFMIFFHIVKVPGIFLFSSSGGKFCCSFRFNGHTENNKSYIRAEAKLFPQLNP